MLGDNRHSAAEQTVIQQIKLSCGAEYTSSLEGIFQDIQVAEQLNTQYRLAF